MELLITILVTFFAGMGAGLGTRLCGNERSSGDQSHADHFLGHGTLHGSRNRLSSDVLASAVSAYTYGKNKNLDIKNGLL